MTEVATIAMEHHNSWSTCSVLKWEDKHSTVEPGGDMTYIFIRHILITRTLVHDSIILCKIFALQKQVRSNLYMVGSIKYEFFIRQPIFRWNSDLYTPSSDVCSVS